ncbi:MAG: glycoside hydrolase family 20 zincin-like fold domain-containing protein [Flavobacteriaceae bacterium]|jgi:hexosaminidase
MKIKTKLVLLLSTLFLTLSCEPQNQFGDFKLLPHPQEWKISGNSQLDANDLKSYFSPSGNDLPPGSNFLNEVTAAKSQEQAQLIYVIDESLDIKTEGYLMDITSHQVQITAKDQAGLIYGLATLEQLMEDAQEQKVKLPLCHIKDYPLIPYRAIHWDIKHHRETLEYYYTLIDKLKKYKINAVIAEVEDKIKYKRQPLVGSSDALTIEEWQKLSEYAIERNISISPLVQGLGHASFVLKHEKYKSLRDDPQSDWAFDPLNPDTYEVQYDLYRDAMEAFPHGKYLHVGGDEVKTTGRKSGKSPLELQLIWLNKVCQFADEAGRTPIFWDDMPLKQTGVYRPMFRPKMSKAKVDSVWSANQQKLKAVLPQFPKNCVYMRWNYHSPEAYGNTKTMQWFKENGLKVMGATAGQTRWVLMPQRESNMKNIRSFALSTIETGLNGLLLTLWDDDSPHFELYHRGIIAFANDTWSGDQLSISELKKAYRQREFSQRVSDDQFAFIDSLEQPVSQWKNILLKGNKRNYLMEMEKPEEEGLIGLPDPAEPGQWTIDHLDRIAQAEKMIESSKRIGQKIQQMQKLSQRNAYTLEVYQRVNEIVQLTPKILLALKQFDHAANTEERIIEKAKIIQLRKDFYNLKDEVEKTYAKTRVIFKPQDYLLDQDHHHHLANQTHTLDWQFYPEMLMFDKINKELQWVKKKID